MSKNITPEIIYQQFKNADKKYKNSYKMKFLLLREYYMKIYTRLTSGEISSDNIKLINENDHEIVIRKEIEGII